MLALWKQKFVLLLTLVALWNVCNGQTATYRDVAVIINQNSEISEQIGTYFAEHRGIPENNIIRIATSTNEEIDSITFENLRQQVEAILISRNLKDSINYLVTTKGMPLKVSHTNSSANASVESELMLILGQYATMIGTVGRSISPYYKKSDDFSRAKYGIYLVTRLDGYSAEDILRYVEATANIPATIPSNAQFVFDQDPTWNSSILYLNTNMQKAALQLQSRQCSTVLDTTTQFLTNITNVLGYVSWGSNDRNQSLYTTNAIPHFTWLPGAIAETYVSTSGRTFNYPPTYGQSLVADLIAEGASAVKGYVYEPYSSAMTDVSILFQMYGDGYTVAESFFASAPSISWMDVVIGDPKYRLVSTRLPHDVSYGTEDGKGVLPVELTTFHATVQSGGVLIEWKTATETFCIGFDIERKKERNDEWEKIGFAQGSGTSAIPHSYSFVDKDVTSGSFQYRLRQIDGDGSINYSNVIEVKIERNVENPIISNYPNPCNPSTKIEFVVPLSGRATLNLYNTIGQKVCTLFEGNVNAQGVVTIPFDGSRFPSGVYYCVMEWNGARTTHRIMILK
ncbi:MAG TPA: TIGR03790 family protein [Bacteroidota bacterium]|jgi:uncharacterized protein (TIGR03790 family)|nr:TIGR03790 family protein [Bacteroidota bacterium]